MSMNTHRWPKAFADFAKMVEFNAAHGAALIAHWKATRGMETGRRLFWQMQFEGWFDGESRKRMTPEAADAVTAYAATIGIKVGTPVEDKWRHRHIGGATIRLFGASKRPVYHGIMDDADAPGYRPRSLDDGIEIKTIWNPWGRP